MHICSHSSLPDMSVLQTNLRKTTSHRLPRPDHTMCGNRISGGAGFSQFEKTWSHTELLLIAQLDRIGHHGTFCHSGNIHHLLQVLFTFHLHILELSLNFNDIYSVLLWISTLKAIKVTISLLKMTFRMSTIMYFLKKFINSHKYLINTF